MSKGFISIQFTRINKLQKKFKKDPITDQLQRH